MGRRETMRSLRSSNRPGPGQGYAVVAGRNLADRGNQILIERAFASAWGIEGGGHGRTCRGSVASGSSASSRHPDDVGFPLAKPRFYLSRPGDRRAGSGLIATRR